MINYGDRRLLAVAFLLASKLRAGVVFANGLLYIGIDDFSIISLN